MKDFWKVFKQYYLLDLIIYGGVLSIIGYYFGQEANWNLISYLLYFGMLIPLFILITGSFGLIKYEFLRPKKIRKELKTSPFSDFRRKGFKQVDNKLLGQIRDYDVCIGIEWENYQKKPIYYYRVLYNPLSFDRYISFDEFSDFNELIAENDFYINPNAIEMSQSKKKHSKYHFSDILKEINKMIDFLEIKRLYSISYEEWKKSMSRGEIIENSYLSKT